MQSLKTAFLLAVMLGVGYGVHVVLNKSPTSGDSATWNDGTDVVIPAIDFGTGPPASSSGGPNPATQPSEFDNNGFGKGPAPLAGSTGDTFPSQTSTTTILPPISDPPPTPSGNLASTAVGPPGASSVPPGGGDWRSVAPPTLSGTDPSSPGSGGTTNAAIPSQDPYAIQTPSSNFSGNGLIPPLPSPGSQVVPAAHSDLPQNAFEDAWRSADAKMQSQQYVDALLTLSMLYSDEGLLEDQRSQLIPPLDQLAGSVIYSNQHLLEPPHTVVAGDTWSSLAARYNLPPGFLPRVNQLPEASPPPPGTVLKVVRGPFRGEVHVGRRELTLFLGRFYAGRFGVEIGRDLPEAVSMLEVAETSGPQPYRDPRTGQTLPAGTPGNPLGNLWIGLRDLQGSQGAFGIHTLNSSVEADDARGCIAASDRDVGDLQAILSVGSRIQIRR